ILSQVIIVTILYLSSIFYRELPQAIQRKFKRFIIGLILMDIALLLITTGNMQLIPTTNSFLTIILFLSLVLGSILIYFGIVRKK
ncbi:MAG: hypothetical protein ACFFD2_23935, partial [Promethearchaeota archaeon]